MNVFFSWSGNTSREIAEVFNVWLPKVVQKVEPFFSPIDVAKGTRWQSEIASKLEGCSIGFLFMTKQNLTAPWIMFEAGALSKHIAESRICCLLFGVGVGEIKGPLEQFNHTMFQKEDLFKIILMVNDVVPGRTLPRDQMEAVFEQWWPELEGKVQGILDKAKDDNADVSTVPVRLSDDDYFKEMKSLVEFMRTTAREISGVTRRGRSGNVTKTSQNTAEIKQMKLHNALVSALSSQGFNKQIVGFGVSVEGKVFLEFGPSLETREEAIKIVDFLSALFESIVNEDVIIEWKIPDWID